MNKPVLAQFLYNEDRRAQCLNLEDYCSSRGIHNRDISQEGARNRVYLVWVGTRGALIHDINFGTEVEFHLTSEYFGQAVSVVCGCCDPEIHYEMFTRLTREHKLQSISVRKPHRFDGNLVNRELLTEDFSVSRRIHEECGHPL